MRSATHFLVVLMTSLILGSQGFAQPNSDCRSWSRGQWDQQVQAMSWGFIYNTPGASTLRELETLRRQCSGEIARMNIEPCLARLTAYAQQFAAPETHFFSSVLTNEEYYATAPAEHVALPSELASARHGLPPDWKALAERKGWKWANYQSEVSDESRLVLWIPDGLGTKTVVYWLVGCNQDPTKYTEVQMQYFQRRDASGNFDQPREHFRVWAFDGPNQTPKLVTQHLERHVMTRCLSCHPNGPREIHPNRKPCFPTTTSPGLTLDEFNAKLTDGRAPVDLRPFYDLSNFPTHVKLGAEQKCTSCHGTERAASFLTMVTQRGHWLGDEITFKVQGDGSMPRGIKLDPEVRDSFSTRFQDEYRKRFREWINETKCELQMPAQVEEKSNPPPVDAGVGR